MKDKILLLRANGKSYNEIKEILGCSKSTISFHCGEGQKEKNLNRQRKNRKNNPLQKKLEIFKSRSIQTKARDFQRNRNSSGVLTEGRVFNFKEKDVLMKIIKNPICYLTGREIDLFKTSSYHFDHIIPCTKGGDGSIENLGLACKEANIAKSNLTKEEFLQLCVDVLNNNGYVIQKK